MRCPVPECFERGLEVEKRFADNAKNCSDYNVLANTYKYETMR